MICVIRDWNWWWSCGCGGGRDDGDAMHSE